MCAEFSLTSNNEAITLRDVIDTLREKNFDSTKWMELGLTLGLAHIRLKEFEKNYRDDCSRCLTETIDKWLNGADEVETVGLPCWGTLADALRRLKEYTMADDIQQKHERSMLIAATSTPEMAAGNACTSAATLDDKHKELEKRLEKTESDLELLRKKDLEEADEQVKDNKGVFKKTYDQVNKGKNTVMNGVTKGFGKGIGLISKKNKN